MKHTLILIFSLCVGVLNAQNTNPLDDKYTPAGSFDITSDKNEDNNSTEFTRNTIVFPIAELFRSEVSLKYLYHLNNDLCILASFGLPFGEDNVELLRVSIAENYSYEDDLSLTELLPASDFKSGFLYSTAVRYLFNPVPNSSNYLEAEFKHVNRKYFLNEDINVEDASERDYTMAENTLLFSGGKIWFAGHGKTKFVYDLSAGIGVKKSVWDEYVANSISYPIYSKSGDKSHAFAPVLSVRFNLGIGW